VNSAARRQRLNNHLELMAAQVFRGQNSGNFAAEAASENRTGASRRERGDESVSSRLVAVRRTFPWPATFLTALLCRQKKYVFCRQQRHADNFAQCMQLLGCERAQPETVSPSSSALLSFIQALVRRRFH
jgi:hypothetical protein